MPDVTYTDEQIKQAAFIAYLIMKHPMFGKFPPREGSPPPVVKPAKQWLICPRCMSLELRGPDEPEGSFHSCWNHVPKTRWPSILRIPTEQEIRDEMARTGLEIQRQRTRIKSLKELL